MEAKVRLVTQTSGPDVLIFPTALFPGTRLDQRAQKRSALEAGKMSGTMSKYILEEEDIQCSYPDIGHCPVKCMSRSYAHMFLRFQNLEQSISEIKCTLDTVMDYVIRGNKSSSSSDSNKARDKKKATKKGKKSCACARSGSDVDDQEMLDDHAIIERDFPELVSWNILNDEGGKPKKLRTCEAIHVYLKTGISSDEGNSSEQESSGDEHHSGVSSEAVDVIVRKVSQVIDNMAKVVDDIQATAEIAEQLASDVVEMQAQIDEDGGQSTDEEENDQPNYAEDFRALYNEKNDVD